ncbi:CocE/NonD family hydrolase [bacterium]|nr:CocE/NonD family hydrolase [bacterium]
MEANKYRLGLLATGLLCLATASCGGGSAAPVGNTPDPTPPDVRRELESRLDAEFSRLGLEPLSVEHAAPTAPHASVFDMVAEQTRADGSGYTLLLSWTEVLAGDADLSGTVDKADLDALEAHHSKSVDYRDPRVYHGEQGWPQGYWWDDQGRDIPPADSGAANWRMARVDANRDGTISEADVQVIAENWHSRISAYVIEWQQPGESGFSQLPNPVDDSMPFTVWRSAAFPEGSQVADPYRPVRYYFELQVPQAGQYSFRVRPFDELSGTAGDAGNPASVSAGGPGVMLDGSELPSELSLAAPGEWRFDASGSSAEAGIAAYDWDLDGNGSFETATGATPTVDHSFGGSGAWRVSVRVTDGNGLANVASRVVYVEPVQQMRPAAYKVRMSDGVRLSTHVYLPQSGSGPWPVMLVRTPYGKDPSVYLPLAEEMNNAGYALVTQDMRGRYESEGNLSIPLEGEDMLEPRDGVDTFDWLNTQEWCNGSIGSTGGSMLGMTQLYSAPHHPQGLKGQFIGVAPASMYHQFVYVGGAFRQMQMEQWVDIAGFDPQSLEIWRAHPEYDEYWEQFNIANTAADVQVPGMHYGGWFDTFSQGTIDSWSIRQKQGGQGARGRQWLVMGPWGHGTEYNRKQGEIEFPENAIKPPDYPYPMFMDHFVLGTDTGLLERPFVTYYRMGAIAEEGAPGNDWQFADDWPVPHSVASYYLHADGSLSTQAPLEPETMQWSFDPSDPTPTVGGRNLYEPKGMFDQRSIEGRSDNLLFTTDPLAQPLEVTGRVLANLFIASDAVDTDVAVRLSDVYPDGRSILVLDGILRLRYRNGFSEAVLLVPDERTEVEVDLWSTSYVFNSGHRIRLALTSSNHARWDLNPGTGEVWVDGGEYVVQENTVYFGPQQASALLLPVVQ